jgi:hypothetical protein
MNFLPIWNIVKKNEISQMSISTDDDAIFAFDVSRKLKDAKSKGDLVSFLLLPISNSSYKVDFMSRETGSGPYLCVAPYPAELVANLTSIQIPPIEDEDEDDIDEMVNETAANETVMNETAVNKTIPILNNETQDIAQTVPAEDKEIAENQTAMQA